MTKIKKDLTGFTLKLSDDDLKQIKILSATDKSFQFQYEVFDAAIMWALENKERLVAIANQKTGAYRTYYVCEGQPYLATLESSWNCNATRALHSSIVHYLKHRSTPEGADSIAAAPLEIACPAGS